MKINLEIEFILNDNVKITKKHILLLQQIKTDKSISKAAKNLNISYKNAWDSLDEISKASEYNLFSNTSRKEGSKLSAFSEDILKKYEEFCKFKAKLNDDFTYKLSAQNKIKAKIVEIKNEKNYINLTCKCGDDLIKANISVAALTELNLKLFDEVILITKINFIELENNKENSFNAIIQNIDIKDELIYFTLNFNNQIIKAIGKKNKLCKNYSINDVIQFQIPAKKIIISL